MMRNQYKQYKWIFAFVLCICAVFLFGTEVRAAVLEVHFPVRVLVGGSQSSEKVRTVVQLEPIYAGLPLPAQTELEVEPNSSVSFGPISLTDLKDHVYFISVKDLGQTHVNYDKRVYRVTASVVMINGQKEVFVWAKEEGGTAKADEMLFINRYMGPSDGSGGSSGGGGGSSSGGNVKPGSGTGSKPGTQGPGAQAGNTQQDGTQGIGTQPETKAPESTVPESKPQDPGTASASDLAGNSLQQDAQAVKTGDDVNLNMWNMLFAASCFMVLFLVYEKKKGQKKFNI